MKSISIKITRALRTWEYARPAFTLKSGRSIPAVRTVRVREDRVRFSAARNMSVGVKAREGRVRFPGSPKYESNSWLAKSGENRSNAARVWILQGMELGVANDVVFGSTNSKQGEGHFGLMTKNVITRSDGYMQGVVMALSRFVHPHLF